MNIRPLESLTKEELIELIRHECVHIEQPLAMAPEGWRLVPVEPTPGMILCGWHIGLSPKEAYVEMLAAAPQPDHIPGDGGNDSIYTKNTRRNAGFYRHEF